jgi:hypothetical protein
VRKPGLGALSALTCLLGSKQKSKTPGAEEPLVYATPAAEAKGKWWKILSEKKIKKPIGGLSIHKENSCHR